MVVPQLMYVGMGSENSIVLYEFSAHSAYVIICHSDFGDLYLYCGSPYNYFIHITRRRKNKNQINNNI